MDLIEIGAMLREARERKGLSLEAVEEKTKISPSVISALEEGNQARFPHAVYARGFVRSYALLLGLDAVELCAQFSREYPIPAESDHPEVHAPQIRVRMHDSHGVVTMVRVVAVLSIVLLGALGWYAFSVYQSRTAPAPVSEPAPATEQAPPVAPSQSAAPESMPAPLTQMQEVAAEPQIAAQEMAPEANVTAPEAAAPATAAAPAASTGQQVQASAPAAPAQATEQTPPAAGKERTLRISAHSASWLQARPDDKVVDYFLRKGESATIAFSKTLSVKFGNAGGVKLELDGQPYPFDAKLGEVRTLVVE